MSTNLPDFDDMLKISDRIGNLSEHEILLEDELDVKLAKITHITSTNSKYFIDGKAPSMIYTESHYHKAGIDEPGLTGADLRDLRKRIAGVKGELRRLKNRFRVMSKMVDVWKADQYNKNQAEY